MWSVHLCLVLMVLTTAYSKAQFMTSENFYDNLYSDETMVILFYEPGCLDYFELLESFHNIGRFYETKNVSIVVGIMDASKSRSLFNFYHLRDTPVILLFRGPRKSFPVMNFKYLKDALIVDFINEEMGWDYEFYFVDSRVINVDEEHLNSTMHSFSLTNKRHRTYSLVFFYLHSCTYCSKIRSRFRHAASLYDAVGDRLQFLEINCEANKKPRAWFNLETFPQIMMIRSDGKQWVMEEHKKVRTIVDFITPRLNYTPTITRSHHHYDTELMDPMVGVIEGLHDHIIGTAKWNEESFTRVQQTIDILKPYYESVNESLAATLSIYQECLDTVKSSGIGELEKQYEKLVGTIEKTGNDMNVIIKTNIMRSFVQRQFYILVKYS